MAVSLEILNGFLRNKKHQKKKALVKNYRVIRRQKEKGSGQELPSYQKTEGGMEGFTGVPFSDKALQELRILQSAKEFVALRYVSIDVKMRCLLCDMCAEGAESVLNHVQNQHTEIQLSDAMFNAKVGSHSEPERLPAIQKQREPSIYEDEQDTLFDFDFKPPMLDLQSEFDFHNDGALHISYTRDLINNGANVAKVSTSSGTESNLKQDLGDLNTHDLCINSEPTVNIGSSCHAATVIREIANESCNQVPTNQIGPQANRDLSALLANPHCADQFQIDSCGNIISSNLVNESTQAVNFGSNGNAVSKESNGNYFNLDSNVHSFTSEAVTQNCYGDFSAVSMADTTSTEADPRTAPQQCSSEMKQGFDVGNINAVNNDSDVSCLQNCDMGGCSETYTSTINEKDIMSCRIGRFKPTVDMIFEDSKNHHGNTTCTPCDNLIPAEKLTEHSYSKVESGNSMHFQHKNMEAVDANLDRSGCPDAIPDHTDHVEQMDQNIMYPCEEHDVVECVSSFESQGSDSKVNKSFDEGSSFDCGRPNGPNHTSHGSAVDHRSRIKEKKVLQRSSRDDTVTIEEQNEKKPASKIIDKRRKKEKQIHTDRKLTAVENLVTASEKDLEDEKEGTAKEANPNVTILRNKIVCSNAPPNEINDKTVLIKSPAKLFTSKRKLTNSTTGRNQESCFSNMSFKKVEVPSPETNTAIRKEIRTLEENLSAETSHDMDDVLPVDAKKEALDIRSSSKESNIISAKSIPNANKIKKRKSENKKQNKFISDVSTSNEFDKEAASIKKEKRPLTCVYCVEEFSSVSDCLRHYDVVHKDGLQTRVEKTNQHLVSEAVKLRRNIYIKSRSGKHHIDDFGIGIKVDVRKLKKLAKVDKTTAKKIKLSEDVESEDLGNLTENSDDITTDTENGSEEGEEGDSITNEDAEEDGSGNDKAVEVLKSKKKAKDSDRYRTCPLCYDKLKKDALENHIAIIHYWNRVSRNNNSCGEFVCEECKKVFKYKKNLNSHKKTVHKGEKRYHCYSSRPDLKCLSCDYVTKERRRLEVHVQSKHMGLEMPFKCQYCDFTSKERTATKDHTYRHFKQKPFSCAHCEFSCIQKNSMKTHLSKKHDITLPNVPSCKESSKSSEGLMKRQSILDEHKKHIIVNTIDNIEVKKLDIHSLLGPTYSEKELRSLEKEANKPDEVKDSRKATNDRCSELSSEEYINERVSKPTSKEQSQKLSVTTQVANVSSVIVSSQGGASSGGCNIDTLPKSNVSLKTSCSSVDTNTLMPKRWLADTPIFIPAVPSSLVANALPIGQALQGCTATSGHSGVTYKVTPSVTIVSSTKTSTIQYKPVTPVVIGPAILAPAVSNQNYYCKTAAEEIVNKCGNIVQQKVVQQNKGYTGQRNNSISVEEILLSDNNHRLLNLT